MEMPQENSTSPSESELLSELISANYPGRKVTDDDTGIDAAEYDLIESELGIRGIG